MLYYVNIEGGPVGMSLDPARKLLYAALRTAGGEVAVVFDDGQRLTELPRLHDPELGPVHDVEYHQGRLYVLEDGATPAANALKALQSAGINPQGKNRISRYRLVFGQERQLSILTRK